MVNTTTKGRRSSAKTRALGEERGYRVATIPHARYSKDLFGVVDQVWVKKTPVLDSSKWRIDTGCVFVQVKSNSWGSVRKLMMFSACHLNLVKIIRWDDRKGYRERTFYRGKEGS